MCKWWNDRRIICSDSSTGCGHTDSVHHQCFHKSYLWQSPWDRSACVEQWVSDVHHSCCCRFHCNGNMQHQVHDGKYPWVDSACISDPSNWLPCSPSLSLPPSVFLCQSSDSCCSAVQTHSWSNLETPVKPVKCESDSESLTFPRFT